MAEDYDKVFLQQCQEAQAYKQNCLQNSMYIKKHDKKSTLALFTKSTTMEVIPSDISVFTLKIN